MHWGWTEHGESVLADANPVPPVVERLPVGLRGRVRPERRADSVCGVRSWADVQSASWKTHGRQ